MFGPYPLMSPPIRKHVLSKPGAYVLFTDKNEAVYCSRSDTNLNATLQQHLSETNECIKGKNATKFFYQNTAGPKEAYELECTNFHKYNPPCNDKHPAKGDAAWVCPVCKS